MALHAILEIADAFFKMFRANIRFVMFMTAVTGVCRVSDRMACRAGDQSLFAMIEREGVLAIEFGGRPRVCTVTGRAVCAKLTEVLLRFHMAGNAGYVQSLELAVLMAIFAGYVRVLAGQRESGALMFKSCIFPIIGRMANRTIGAKLTVMIIIFPMA